MDLALQAMTFPRLACVTSGNPGAMEPTLKFGKIPTGPSRPAPVTSGRLFAIAVALLMVASPVNAQTGPQVLEQQALAAKTAGNLEAAASLYEQSASQCGAAAQLALVDIYRKGKGRRPDGELAFAWLISAQRATDQWNAQAVAKFERLIEELPAYMSDAQRDGAYCRGLKLLAQSCGAGSILRRIERWLACS